MRQKGHRRFYIGRRPNLAGGTKSQGLAAPGFTLVEIIVALTLSVVVFTILFSALRLGQRSQEKGLERDDISQRMRIISDRLTWLIRGAYPYMLKKPEGNVLFFSGTESSLGFVTTSVDSYPDSPEDRAGLKWVSISVDSEGLKIKENIFFLEGNPGGDSAAEYVFDPNVKSMEFEYLDVGKEDKKGKWLSEWSKDKEYLPNAVKVRVVIIHNGKEFEVPPLIAAIRTGGPF